MLQEFLFNNQLKQNEEASINTHSVIRNEPKILGIKEYLGTYATSLVIQGLTIIQGILLARFLGPAGRGELAAIILWPTIFAGLGTFGIFMALARRAGKTNNIAPLVKSAVILSLCTGCISAVGCFFLLPYVLPSDMTSLAEYGVLFIAFIPLNHLTINLMGIDQGVGNISIYNNARLIVNPVYLVGLIASLFFAQDKLLWVVVSLLVGNGCVALFCFVTKWRDLWNDSTLTPLIQLTREALPFQLSIIVGMFIQNVDQIILLWLLSPHELGIYTVAKSAGGLIASLPLSLEILSFSEATRLDSTNGLDHLAAMVRRGFLCSLLLSILLIPFLPLLIPLMYGDGFVSAVPISIIILAGVIFSGMASIVEQALRGHGKPIVGITARLLGLVTMIITGIVAVKYLGASGIALSWSISQIFILVSLLISCKKIFVEMTLKTFLPTVKDVQYISKILLFALQRISNRITETTPSD